MRDQSRTEAAEVWQSKWKDKNTQCCLPWLSRKCAVWFTITLKSGVNSASCRSLWPWIINQCDHYLVQRKFASWRGFQIFPVVLTEGPCTPVNWKAQTNSTSSRETCDIWLHHIGKNWLCNTINSVLSHSSTYFFMYSECLWHWHGQVVSDDAVFWAVFVVFTCNWPFLTKLKHLNYVLYLLEDKQAQNKNNFSCRLVIEKEDRLFLCITQQKSYRNNWPCSLFNMTVAQEHIVMQMPKWGIVEL